MPCSPTNLFVDHAIWSTSEIIDNITRSFRSLSEGDQQYDCALTSVPCESNLTTSLAFSEDRFVFWFDATVMYAFLPILVLLGIVGNVINIAVFSKNKIASDSINSLLIGLSASDLINVLCLAIVNISFFLCFIDVPLALSTFSSTFINMCIISRWFSLLSLDFVTLIAIQRAAAVLIPFKAANIFSPKNTKIAMTVLTFLCLILSIPAITGVSPRWVYHPYFKSEIALGIEVKFSLKLLTDYVMYYVTMRSFLDLVVILISIPLTIRKLKKQVINRENLSAVKFRFNPTRQRQTVYETKVIKMSLTVCLITFLVFTVSIVVTLMTGAKVEELFQSPISAMSEYSNFILTAINSSFNFFLYTGMCKKYRKTLQYLFS